MIPEVPAFSGDIKEASAIQTIMGAQYRTINRGGDSIMVCFSSNPVGFVLILSPQEKIRAAGYNP
jgi:phospholipase D1/2